MSKIFDALRKSRGSAGDLNLTPAAPPAYPEVEPEPSRRAEIEIHPSDLELPLEFVRELGTLRGSLDQLLPGRQQKTLLVAGAVGGEGASTVAVAFARLLAEDEHLRVALVDADLRSVRRRLPVLDPGSGFAGVLGMQVSIDRALVGTTLPNLAFLPGGISAESPLRLCTAENCRAAFEYLKRHFHYVIVDGPPLLEAPEAAGIVGQADGTIVVVRASRTKREVVQRAIDVVEKMNGRVLGAVLNRRQYIIPDFIYRRI